MYPRQSKSRTVADVYDTCEFDDLLDAAEANAHSDWAMSFVEGLRERWDKYGDRMYLSPRQEEFLERLAEGD